MSVDHIHWLGHASFRIQDGAAEIYVDPWKVSAASPKATVILITHGHYDHFSPDDIGRIAQPATIFVAPPDVAARLAGRHVIEAPGKLHRPVVAHLDVPHYAVRRITHVAPP